MRANRELFHKKKNKVRPEILLHPNIPKPLHGMNPRSILGTAWWDKQRQIAYAKEDYHCMACGVHKTDARYHKWLEAHECYEFDYSNGVARMIEIVALCHCCHNFIHSGKLLMDYQSGRINRERYDYILAHGEKVIRPIRNTKNPYIINETSMADWSKWRLIIEDKEYFSKFKDFDDWRRHYQ